MSNYLTEKKGITINCIAPGNMMFKGSIWEKKLINSNIKTIKYLKENVPSNEFGNPEDIFNIIEVILKSKSKFFSGSTYVVDGGQTKKFF